MCNETNLVRKKLVFHELTNMLLKNMTFSKNASLFNCALAASQLLNLGSFGPLLVPLTLLCCVKSCLPVSKAVNTVFMHSCAFARLCMYVYVVVYRCIYACVTL